MAKFKDRTNFEHLEHIAGMKKNHVEVYLNDIIRELGEDVYDEFVTFRFKHKIAAKDNPTLQDIKTYQELCKEAEAKVRYVDAKQSEKVREIVSGKNKKELTRIVSEWTDNMDKKAMPVLADELSGGEEIAEE